MVAAACKRQVQFVSLLAANSLVCPYFDSPDGVSNSAAEEACALANKVTCKGVFAFTRCSLRKIVCPPHNSCMNVLQLFQTHALARPPICPGDSDCGPCLPGSAKVGDACVDTSVCKDTSVLPSKVMNLVAQDLLLLPCA